jgi:hemerythrin-like metal-binding protein
MSRFQWDESFSVKVSKFDDQHKKLFGLVNLMFNAMSEGRGREVLGDLFNELADYVETHFKAEEAAMRVHRYPYTDEHMAEHEKLRAKVREYREAFDSGKVINTIGVLNFLKDWLTGHIMNTDKRYSAHMNDAGLR